MLAQKYRFHGHGSLRYVYRNGKTERNRALTLRYVKNPHRNKPRIAVIIGKKVIKSAVKRNRVRRRIYEIIRQQTELFSVGCDITITVFSADTLTMPHQELETSLKDLLGRV